jgi:MerR family transcriptional regulator, thiopeptide resistance regulator
LAENWQKIQSESEDFTRKLAELTDKPINDPEVQKQIKRHYKWISIFYDCPLEMYRNLGKMYVEDARFTAHYDKYKPGLEKFMEKAIGYFCENNG